MIAFAGTGILCLTVSASSVFLWNEPGAKFALAASLLYLVGCIGVTAIGNVPLNDQLASLGDTAEAVVFWPRYVPAWNLWNHIRSASGILSAALFTSALCQR